MKRLFALLLGITFAFTLGTASGEAVPALAAVPDTWTRTCNRPAPQDKVACQRLEE